MKLFHLISLAIIFFTKTSDAANLRTSATSGEDEQQNHRELGVASTSLSSVKDGDQFHIYHNGHSRFVRAKGEYKKPLLGAKEIDYLLDGVTNHDSWELFQFNEIPNTSPQQYYIYNIGQGRYLNEYSTSFPTTTDDQTKASKWIMYTKSNNKICIFSKESDLYLRMDHEYIFLGDDKYTMRLQSHCRSEEEFLLVRPDNAW